MHSADALVKWALETKGPGCTGHSAEQQLAARLRKNTKQLCEIFITAMGH